MHTVDNNDLYSASRSPQPRSLKKQTHTDADPSRQQIIVLMDLAFMYSESNGM
jgi:hypothetical protein